MRSTATTRRLQMHRVWLTMTLVVLLGVVAASAALAMTRDEGIPETITARPAIEPKTNDNFRFAEMNALPDSAPLQIVNFDHYRFNEMNELPDDADSRVAPASDRLGERH